VVLAGLQAPSVCVGLWKTSVPTLSPVLFFTLPLSICQELDVSGSQLTTLGLPLLAALDEQKGGLAHVCPTTL
jgi:hypothetical protein